MEVYSIMQYTSFTSTMIIDIHRLKPSIHVLIVEMTVYLFIFKLRYSESTYVTILCHIIYFLHINW